MLYITQRWRQNVNLRPVKPHVYQNQLKYAGVNQLVDVFTLKVVYLKFLELIACQSHNPQVSKLLHDVEVLIPAVEQIFIKIKVHRTRNQTLKRTILAKTSNFHVFEGNVAAIAHVCPPVVALLNANDLNLLHSALLVCVYIQV